MYEAVLGAIALEAIFQVMRGRWLRCYPEGWRPYEDERWLFLDWATLSQVGLMGKMTEKPTTQFGGLLS
jgi:hypothetical protein